MHAIEVILIMLLAVVISGYLVRLLPFSLPLPLIQIALGAIIAGGFQSGVTLDPAIFFQLFLPPLLFLDGWRIPKVGLMRDGVINVELALGLVVFTVVGAGFLIHWLIPTIPLPVAFALAAVISPTDPVAVSSIAAKVPIPKRMMHILEGESLLNDASGLVCFRFAVAAAMTGTFSLASASATFLWVAGAGLAIGVAFTWSVTQAQLWLSRIWGEEAGSSILISLLLPFGAYLLAEHFQASGILAAVAAGIMMSHVELSGRALPATRVQRAAVWDTVQFALNGIMFVLLGEQLPGIISRAVESVQLVGRNSAWWLLAYAVAISLTLALLRFSWVWVSLQISLFRRKDRADNMKGTNWRIIAAMSLAGVRGAITLAGVLSLPLLLPDGQAFPARDLVIFLAAMVILVSLIAASLCLPRLLRGLTLPAEPAKQTAEDFARQEAAKAAIAAIDIASQSAGERSAEEAERYANAAVRVMAHYQSTLHSQDITNSIDAEALRLADEAETTLRLAGLQAERDAIFQLARRYEISDDLSRKLVRQIDLLEARYRS
jgi:CPA1 family monovalent cation:H+ antiporter